MKGEKAKTSESCAWENSSESERYEGAPTLIGIVGDELVEVQLFLKVNREKTHVGSVHGQKFLGYSFNM